MLRSFDLLSLQYDQLELRSLVRVIIRATPAAWWGVERNAGEAGGCGDQWLHARMFCRHGTPYIQRYKVAKWYNSLALASYIVVSLSCP